MVRLAVCAVWIVGTSRSLDASSQAPLSGRAPGITRSLFFPIPYVVLAIKLVWTQYRKQNMSTTSILTSFRTDVITKYKAAYHRLPVSQLTRAQDGALPNRWYLTSTLFLAREPVFSPPFHGTKNSSDKLFTEPRPHDPCKHGLLQTLVLQVRRVCGRKPWRGRLIPVCARSCIDILRRRRMGKPTLLQYSEPNVQLASEKHTTAPSV